MGQGLRNWHETGGLEGGREEKKVVCGQSQRANCLLSLQNPGQELAGTNPGSGRARRLRSERAEGREPPDRERHQKGETQRPRGWAGLYGEERL